jgi:hypothetical protein
MHWPQALVFAWMAISGLMEIALINKELEKIRNHQATIREAFTGQTGFRAAGPDFVAAFDVQCKQQIQSSLNAESNAKWKSVGFIFRVFAVRLVILYALHSGGFF